MKPSLDIWMNPATLECHPKPYYVAAWLNTYQPKIINVAGNAKAIIEPEVKLFLNEVYEIIS